MAQFSGGPGGTFTPSTSNDNWTLDANTAGDVGLVKYFSWGGRGTSSVGYRTRWTRPTTLGSGTATNFTLEITSQQVAALCQLVDSWGTSDPTLPSDPANLYAQDWNLLGGGGTIILPIGGEWIVLQGAQPYQQISCRNTAGTDANLSNYTVCWQE